MELDGGIGLAHMIGEKAERLRVQARPASGEAAQGDPEQKRRLCIKGGVFSKGSESEVGFPASEGGDDRALVLFLNEFLHGRRRERFLEAGEFGTAGVSRADRHDVDVGRILAFHKQSVFHRI